MELAVIFSTAFVVGFSGAMMPGPLLTVTIGETARRGFVAGPLIVLGHAILELALVLALVGGLAKFLTNAGVSNAIAFLGGSFLIYMGFGMARDAHAGRVTLSLPGEAAAGRGVFPAGMQSGAGLTPDGAGCCARPAGYDAPAGKTGGGLHPMLAGVLISLANPYWSLWWATIGLGYITISLKNGASGLTSFFSGHIMADLVWYSLIAAVVAGGRKFISDRFYRGLLIACGVFLVGLGFYFIYRGVFN